MSATTEQGTLSDEEREERALFESVASDSPRGPKKLILSPTDWCNLRCETCWRLEKEKNPNEGSAEELSFSEMECLMCDARSLGAKELDLTGGGEPFSRKGIFELLALAKQLGFWVTLTTNGTLLDDTKLKTLVSLGLDDITFSFDGATPRTNDSIRGRGVFAKTRRALIALQEAKATAASPASAAAGSALPVVRIAFVVTARNYREVPAMVRFAKRHGVAAIQFSTLLEWSTNSHLSMAQVPGKPALWEHALGRKAPLSYLEEGARLADAAGIHTNLASLIRHGFSAHATPRFCFAPWEMLFVNSRGTALACCVLASFFENELGSVRDTPLKELWSSEKMRGFRQRLASGKFFKGCERCLPDFMDRFDAMEEHRFRRGMSQHLGLQSGEVYDGVNQPH